MIIYDKNAKIRASDVIRIYSKFDLEEQISNRNICISKETKLRIIQALEREYIVKEGLFLVRELVSIFNGEVKATKNNKFNFYTMSNISEKELKILQKEKYNIVFDSTNILRHYDGLKHPYHLWNY